MAFIPEMISNLIKKDNSIAQLLSGGKKVFAFRLFGMAAAYGFNCLITRHIGEGAYGSFTICYTVLSILSILSLLGLGNANVRFIPLYMAAGKTGKAALFFKKSVSIVSLSSMLAAVFLYCTSAFWAQKLGIPSLEASLRLTALIILPQSLLQLYAEKFRSMKQPALYAFLVNGAAPILAGIFLLVLFVFFEPQVNLVLWSLLASVVLLLITVAAKKGFKGAQIAISGIHYASMLRSSIPMLFSGLLFLIMSWTDILLLGYFLDENQVAVYSIAYKISMLMTLSLYAVNTVAAPRFSSMVSKGNSKGLKKLVLQTTRLNTLFAIPGFLLLMTFPDFFLSFFGQTFQRGKVVLMILVFGQFVNALGGCVLTLLNMTGNAKTARNIVGISAFLNISLNMIFIPSWGMEGAAVVTVITMVTWNSLGIWSVKKRFGFVMLSFGANTDEAV